MHTLCLNKSCATITFVHKFDQCWPIFIFIYCRILHELCNKNQCHISHHILKVLLNYLAKHIISNEYEHKDTDGEKCSSRSTKFMTLINWSSAWLMFSMVLSKVSSVCESMTFWALNLTPYNAYFILSIIFVIFVNSKEKSLRYLQQNFASFDLLFWKVVE